MNEVALNFKIIFFAIIGGLIPAILWLWFWLKEEDFEEREPIGLIIISFILGALTVFLAIWLEGVVEKINLTKTWQIISWASVEEILKTIVALIVIYGSQEADEPIDYPVYFMAIALGFAALENVFFLINPLQTSGTIVGMLTGNLRFLGSTLLHAMASGLVGISLGLSFYLKKYYGIYLILGLFLAITLHSVFNFFIMKEGGENFLEVFGFLWVITIINILIFEKLRRIKVVKQISN